MDALVTKLVHDYKVLDPITNNLTITLTEFKNKLEENGSYTAKEIEKLTEQALKEGLETLKKPEIVGIALNHITHFPNINNNNSNNNNNNNNTNNKNPKIGNKSINISLTKDSRSELHEIFPNIYLTNYFAARNKEKLIEKNITHILVVAAELETPFKDLYCYHKLNAVDNPSYDIIQHLPQAFYFIQLALENKNGNDKDANNNDNNTNNTTTNNNKVLLHCAAGASRSASITIAYVMWKNKLSYKQVYQQLKSLRPCIEPNFGFVEKLTLWEKNGWPVQLATSIK